MTPDEDVTTGHGAGDGPDVIFADDTHTTPAIQVAAAAPGANRSVAETASTRSTLSSKEPGIYTQIDGKVTTVSSSVVAKGKPAGVMSNAATLGFKGVDVKSTIDGSKSSVRVKSANPEFVFRGDSFKPNDYVLVSVEMKDDHRELKTGKVGMFGRVKSDVDKDSMVNVKFSSVEDGVWRVVPEKALKSGEYAFVTATPVPERVWSFGID